MRSSNQYATLIRQAVAIGVAVGAFALSFGVLAADAGLSLPQAVALSTLVFAGSAQLAAVGVAADGGTGAAAVVSGLLLNARLVAFGVPLARVLAGPLPRRLVASQLLIDESSALALTQDDPRLARRAFWTGGLAVFVPWNLGTAAGWALTGAIDVEALGLDAVIPAAFVALLAPRLRGAADRAAAAAGAAIALALTPLTPAGVPIIAATLGAGAGWIALRRHAAERA
ncbi:MAG: AzlC family ABC transporter permease [Thermoleophilia bacterium]